MKLRVFTNCNNCEAFNGIHEVDVTYEKTADIRIGGDVDICIECAEELIDKEKIKKIVINKLSKQYKREEAVEQVENAQINIDGDIVTVTYDNGYIDKLKIVSIKTLAWEGESIDSL